MPKQYLISILDFNMMSGSIWCPAPNKAVDQELVLLLVWFGGRPSFTRLHLCYMYAHIGMYTWVCTFARSSTAAVLAVLHPRQPPFLLGPCASPPPHCFSGYRLSHSKRIHLFRDALLLHRDLLVCHLCLLPSFERRNSLILCLAPP